MVFGSKGYTLVVYMSFEPERPSKRRKIDESSEEPEVRPLPYMVNARTLQAIFMFLVTRGKFLSVIFLCAAVFFTVDEHE